MGTSRRLPKCISSQRWASLQGMAKILPQINMPTNIQFSGEMRIGDFLGIWPMLVMILSSTSLGISNWNDIRNDWKTRSRRRISCWHREQDFIWIRIEKGIFLPASSSRNFLITVLHFMIFLRNRSTQRVTQHLFCAEDIRLDRIEGNTGNLADFPIRKS